jgi:ADP-heptose:LPS heptosyltransferase
MMSDYRDLFEGHPDVARIIPYDMSLFWSMRRLGWNGVVASYMKSNVQDDVDVPPNEHMITAICRQAGLKGEIGIRSYMWLSEKERLAGRVAPRQIVFQTSGLAAKYPSGNKEWFHDRFQYVADKLSRKYKIIQLGSVKDPLLCGAVDLRGKTSFRESAAILSESVVFIGLAGFLMNLARAVDCRSVIIYGGREDPHITGYTCNENLVANLSCAPCWRRATCECSRRCMSLVTCEMVLDAFGRQVERFGSPLEIATEQIL